jgi:hypothetical protein
MYHSTPLGAELASRHRMADNNVCWSQLSCIRKLFQLCGSKRPVSIVRAINKPPVHWFITFRGFLVEVATVI